MITKVAAIIALVTLPLSGLLWRASHTNPIQRRYDVTLYNSLNIYLRDGVCGLHLLTMPTKTGTPSEFHATLQRDPTPEGRSFYLSSKKTRDYRRTWLVFPLWLSTALLASICMLPVVRGPLRRWRRLHKGLCIHCGYDLTGNLSGRCPECGARVELRRLPRSRSPRPQHVAPSRPKHNR